MRKLGGVRAPHRKGTADSAPRPIPIPPEIRLPMSMHIGAPAKPIVKAGDTVQVGQLIGEAAGFVSSPVHASVSGKVKRVDEYDAVTGLGAASVVIESDGEQTPYDGLRAPELSDMKSFLDAVRDSGVVGLGGAGFPTAVKLTVKDVSAVDYILINGAECEPYITSDTRTMLDETEMLEEGALLLQKYLGVKSIVFGVESNKPGPIKKLTEFASRRDGIEVRTLPALYPQGGEKVLIYQITGRRVPEGKLPLDIGVIVLNCTTLTAIVKYIRTGMPLVSKCVTVDGSAVINPGNVVAPIGAPLAALFDFCGGLKDDVKKVLMGGPMMGIAVPDTDMPVLKATNAALAFSEKDALLPAETPCIRCGRCVSHCPMGLAPLEFERTYRLKKPELLEKYKVNLCMECGCCAYSCPAKRMLVQYVKLSKIMLREYQAAQKAAAEKKEAAV
ncbi:MAG: electron transport complex subunit RsxC [Oscillospiraceae bacterium]|jgi:electron transport complex protein RnfC|nr:electron transport complex subunit RsxC [Oscillospiraceae bacterium]